MERLWAQMHGRYGHRWSSQYGDFPEGIAAAEWSSTLRGIDMVSLRRGFAKDALRGDDWPPSSSHFRALCLGIPPYPAVKREMRPGYPDPGNFARAMWRQLDGWAYQRADRERAERMLREAYGAVKEAVMRGAVLPPAPEAALGLHPDPFHPASEATAQAHFAAMREVLRE